MASSDPSPLNTTNIRDLTDQDSIYRAFDAYPWTKDPAFLSGLHAILGPPSSPSPSSRDIATHARIFYYSQRIGVSIDFSSYHAWLALHPDHKTPDILPAAFSNGHSPSPPPSSSSLDNSHPHDTIPSSSNGQTSPQPQPSSSHPHLDPSTPGASSSHPLAWQQAAPKAHLYIDRSSAPQFKPPSAFTATSTSTSTSTSHAQPSAGPGEPNYPLAFADMIRLIQEGKPVPGIRQIPNSIERDSTVSPVGSRPVPRKPWERGTPASALPNSIDLEFPPVDEDT